MNALDSELLSFINRHIDSVSALDALLLLRRSPDTFWAPAAIAEKLGLSQDEAAARVSALCRAGLLARAGTSTAFRFSPLDPAVARCVEGLAAAWLECRTAVVDAIRSKRPQPQQDDARPAC